MRTRLSPEARARLEAARAIAQGKPAPATVEGRNAPGRPGQAPAPVAAGASAAPRPTEPSTPGAARQRVAIAAIAGVILVGGGAAAFGLLGGRRDDPSAKVATIQKGLLSGTADAAARKKAVVEVIRNVDQMSRSELEVARKALEEDWQKARDEAIDAFFAAPEADRDRLADEGVERTLSYRKLCFGLSPQAIEEKPRRQKPPKEKDRRQLFTRYGEAVSARAKTRGIDLPEWQ